MKRLSEADIQPIYDRYLPRGHDFWKRTSPALRDASVEFSNAVLRQFGGGIPGAEVRQRERVAYLLGVRDHATPGYQHNWLERSYPELPPYPRTITLSDGHSFVRDGSEFRSVTSGLLQTPVCYVLEDFEKCAALLRESA